MTIPKRIYQTWKTQQLPRGIDITIKKFLHNNPGYTHYLYDDKDISNFVHVNFPGEISDAFDCLNIGAARADLWRYLILYKCGGIYLDIDADITGKLDELIEPDDKAIITREPLDGLFNQWILIFSKGHPLLWDVITRCVANIKNRSSNNILHLTGSTVFTKAINQMYKNIRIQFNIWRTPDNILKRAFNKKGASNQVRFYGTDMKPFAKYHNDFYEELYNDNNPQWEKEQTQQNIFKDGQNTILQTKPIDIENLN